MNIVGKSQTPPFSIKSFVLNKRRLQTGRNVTRLYFLSDTSSLDRTDRLNRIEIS